MVLELRKDVKRSNAFHKISKILLPNMNQEKKTNSITDKL